MLRILDPCNEPMSMIREQTELNPSEPPRDSSEWLKQGIREAGVELDPELLAHHSCTVRLFTIHHG